ANRCRSLGAARCSSTCIYLALPDATAESVELRLEVRPCGPFRLPLRGGMDGVLRRRGRVLERLLHHGEEPVVVRVAQTRPDCVLFGARARDRSAAAHG